MKLLILSDIHGAEVELNTLVNRYEPDCIVLPGDIPTAIDFPVLVYSLIKGGNRKEYVKNIYQRFHERLTFKQIKSAKNILTQMVRFKLPIIAIHGNTETNETRQWLSLFAHRYENLHWISDGFHKLDDILFIGHGWTEYYPKHNRMRTPGDLDSETEKKILLDTYGRAKQHADHTILVSHDPPYGTSIDFLEHKKTHAGSHAVRKMLDSGYFNLCVSGHLHESFGSHYSSKGWLAINAGAVIENVACTYDTETKEIEWLTNLTSKIGLSKLIYRNRISLQYDKK